MRVLSAILLAAWAQTVPSPVRIPSAARVPTGAATRVPAFLQSNQSSTCDGGTSCSVAFSSSVTTGSSIFALIDDDNAAVSGVTACGQPMSLTFASAAGTSASGMRIWTVANTTSIPCTVTVTSTAEYGTLSIIEASYLAHGSDGQHASSGTSQLPADSGVTTTAANDFGVFLVNGSNALGTTCSSPIGATFRYAHDGLVAVLTAPIPAAGTVSLSCTLGYGDAWGARVTALKQ